MNLKERFKNTLAWMDSIQMQTLKAFEGFLYFMIVADLFGIYWYLNHKRFALSLLIVIIVLLMAVYFLKLRVKSEKEVEDFMARGRPKKKTEKKEPKKVRKENPKDKKEDSDDTESDFEMGIPDADEYQKRIEKALGSGF